MFTGMGETVQVWRAGQPDRYGDRTWSLDHQIHDVLVDWDGSSMNRENRAQQVTDVVLYCPPGADDVRATDRIKVRGRDYAPDGTVAPWSFGEWYPGTAIPLKAVEG